MTSIFGIKEQIDHDPYLGRQLVEECDHIIINHLHTDKNGVEGTQVDADEPLTINEYLTLRNGSASVLAVYGPDKMVRKIETYPAYGILPKNAEQTFALHGLMDPNIPLVTITGKAGTGKTLLALSAALEQRRGHKQVLLSRPAIPLSNRDMGYLPGDIKSKLDPYMAPLFDNIGVIREYASITQNKALSKMQEEEKLVIEPLAFIRGRSLRKMFMIVDEAQNLTPHEVKTIVTRAGEGTKIVFTGDTDQIDVPSLRHDNNGLSYLIERMKGQSLFSHVTLEKSERSGLAELAARLL
jgi:PhoH-like ATPase